MLERDLGLSEVADATGVTIGAVQHWRDGNNFPQGRKKMKQLADYLQLNPDWLYGDSDERVNSWPQVNATLLDFPEDSLMVGSAAAGSGRAYEDLAEGERVPTDKLKDVNSFSIRIEGDSMTPDFPPGIKVVIDTKSDLVSGKPVVVKDAKENVYFKLYFPSADGKTIQLKSLNHKKYPPLTFSKDQVVWIYKAHSKVELI